MLEKLHAKMKEAALISDPAEKAAFYIESCCPTMGSSSYCSDVNNFLACLALDIEKSEVTKLFLDRHKEHIAFALKLITTSNFTDPPAAVGSAYLLTRLEFYFRVLSGSLNEYGAWINPTLQNNAFKAINHSKINKPSISSVALTYKIMKLNAAQKAICIFDSLDKKLPRYKALDDLDINDIGDRIAAFRHPTSHGALGDPSSEAIFYGLITAIIFYSQP